MFTIYALDEPYLGLERGARREEFDHALEGHVLGEATLIGTYARKG
jgi:phosphatidylethanolamine-binding protein (PEBP) family uncharacterized protein